MHYGASVSEVADCTAATSSHSRSLLWRKLSSNRCLVRLDSVIGERGRSLFSMVDSEDSSN